MSEACSLPPPTNLAADSKSQLPSFLGKVFNLDLRSLAIFRWGLGLMTIVDTWIRLEDAKVFYSDAGVFPRTLLLEKYWGDYLHSLFLTSGTPTFAVLYFFVTMAVALLFAVGWRTRAMNVFLWILIIGIQNRNYMVGQGGDMLHRLLIFWGIFLPLGKVWSIDSALVDRNSRPTVHTFSYSSVASICYVLQICMLYWSSIALKSGAEWLDGRAVYYSLNLEFLANRPAYFIRQFPEFMKVSTFASFYTELIAPILLLIPVFINFNRIIAIAALFALHLGIFICIRVGTFAWLDFVSLAALIPGCVWDNLHKRFNRSKAATITIFFDGDCGFCEKSALIIRSLFLFDSVAVKKTQEFQPAFDLMLEKNSWVVRDESGHLHTEFRAFAVALRASAIFYPFSKIFYTSVLNAIGRKFYRLIADRRGFWSNWTAVLLPFAKPRSLRQSWFSMAFCLVSLICAAKYNYWTVHSEAVPQEWVFNFCNFFRLDQKWNMFAPFPMKDDGWFIIEGKLADDTMVDVYHNKMEPPTYEKPELISDEYPNFRWGKYLANLWDRNGSGQRLYYASYLCREWNKNEPNPFKRLKTFDIIYMRKENFDHYSASPEKNVIWSHKCF